MKKTIFTLTLLSMIAIAGQSLAQEKGRFWIGGSVNIDNSESTYINNNSEAEVTSDNELIQNRYTIQPEFGYAFSDRWAAGMRLSIGWSNSSQGGSNVPTSENKTNSWGLAPFVRYTALRWKAFGVFVDGGLSYNRIKTNRTTFYTEGTSNYNNDCSDRYGIFINPGFSLRLSSCIALTGSISFFDVNYEKGSQDGGNSPSSTSTHRDDKGFSAGLNSPFNLDNFSVGLNFSF